MDKPRGKIYFEAVTQYNTSNMRPIICSPIQRRVQAGLGRKDLQPKRLDHRMPAEVLDALTHNLC